MLTVAHADVRQTFSLVPDVNRLGKLLLRPVFYELHKGPGPHACCEGMFEIHDTTAYSYSRPLQYPPRPMTMVLASY